MSEATSIFDTIAAAAADGTLPDGFVLDPPDEVVVEGEDPVRFADGARDGIALYHLPRPDLPPEVCMRINQALDAASSGDFDAADAVFAPLGQEARAVFLVDEIQDTMYEREREIDPMALFAYAIHLLLESRDRELVKIGLVILEIYNEPEEALKEAVRTLGLSNEFTLFAIWNAMNWENGNEEVFMLARKVRGWGRIFAVDKLVPATAEVKRWILLEGCDNDVMPEYSALTCFEKCDLPGLLEGEMAGSEFAAASRMFLALLNEAEGPVEGISGVKDPLGVLKAYLTQASRQHLSGHDRTCIQAIVAYADAKGAGDLIESGEALLSEIR